ncbi:MAG: hypothetical protein IH623_14280 [Verrucomicrobia bacterium]|nr:hypothetical protein [Verrucomicrobiota bacterium]
MIKIQPPFYPIIYVRGYAGSTAEVENTVADPYMGFNVGSTKVRQLWTGQVQRHYFESPLVRLMKDHQYQDVYSHGTEMPADIKIGPRSVIIHRYYDVASSELGQGTRLPIEKYAEGLSELILKVRDRVCQGDAAAIKAFRVYLLAHSMGGLVCRCLLQNLQVGSDDARKVVDKVYTYATPHNGIDLNVIGNIPGFLTYHEADTFNHKRMRKYLALPNSAEDMSSLNGQFDPDRFFCLVGTNSKDYDVAMGLPRLAVGPMSDGLVRIANATVFGNWNEQGKTIRKNSPRALVHRTHSGHYGVVNSEEGYQNLTRFLFGSVRVDGQLEVAELTLPEPIQQAHDAGKEIRASYHFEVVARVRGAQWDLHRRTVAENSAIFRSFDEMLRPEHLGPKASPRHPFLFSLYLDARQRVNPKRRSLGFSLDLGVLVPQYQVDKKFWFDDYYEGSYLYRDKINLEAVPPKTKKSKAGWTLNYGFDSESPNTTAHAAPSAIENGETVFRIPIEKKTKPGITAQLVLRARLWNG